MGKDGFVNVFISRLFAALLERAASGILIQTVNLLGCRNIQAYLNNFKGGVNVFKQEE